MILPIVSFISSTVITLASLYLTHKGNLLNAENARIIKRLELRYPRVFEALGEMSAALTQMRLTAKAISEDQIDSEPMIQYAEQFSAAAYKLAVLIDDKELQEMLFAAASSEVLHHDILEFAAGDDFNKIVERVSKFLSQENDYEICKKSTHIHSKQKRAKVKR